MKKLQNRKGFTLVELLIVMAIIGILILLALPRFSRSTQAATLKTLQSNARSAASAAQLYYADRNDFPISLEELTNANYLDAAVFVGDNTKPKGAVYAIHDATGTVAARTGNVSNGARIVATITLDQLPEDTNATDDFTTVAAGGAVTVTIPFR